MGRFIRFGSNTPSLATLSIWWIDFSEGDLDVFGTELRDKALAPKAVPPFQIPRCKEGMFIQQSDALM